MKFETIPNRGGGSKYSGPKKDDFLSLKDGDSVQGVLTGEPYQFYQHSNWPEKKPSDLCDNPSFCPRCKNGDSPSFRFRINVIIKENGALVAKVFENGWTVWKNLMTLNDKVDLSHNTVDITRAGTGKETTYTIFPLPEGKITDEMYEKLSAIPLVDIEHKLKEGMTAVSSVATDDPPPPGDGDGPPPFDEDDGIPF